MRIVWLYEERNFQVWRQDRKQAPTGSSGAVAGTTLPRTAGQRIATTTTLRTGTTTLASACEYKFSPDRCRLRIASQSIRICPDPDPELAGIPARRIRRTGASGSFIVEGRTGSFFTS